MIKVYYEEYTNDYCRRDKTETFYGYDAFKDWFFNKCRGSYKDKISIPNPDSTIFKKDELPYSMEVNCMWEENKCYWIHKIEKDGKIVFSDGRHTNRIKYWNDDVRQMCREMLAREKNPQFDFG